MKKLTALSVILFTAGALSLSAAGAKDNWAKHCAKCHGADGKGQTVMGKKLGVKDYTDPKVQAEFKDEQLQKATKDGVKDKNGKVTMKGFASTLSDDEIKALVQHVRSFKK